jgi:hypothetical protein
MTTKSDVVIVHEHPEWQKPLFSALERKGVQFTAFDLKQNAFDPAALPQGKVFFNQASPSAYVRGNARSVPLALSLLRSLELGGKVVLNGSAALALEMSKTAQAALLTSLGLRTPRVLTFNDAAATKDHWTRWPCLLKPEQGGSGARIFLLENHAELMATLERTPDIWFPDNLLLLQEYFPVDPARGIIRMEFVGGKFLYAMRVVSHGSFNLCPSEVCNPLDGDGHCAVPAERPKTKPVEFYAHRDIPAAAIAEGERIMAAGNLQVGGIEFLETKEGERVYYDINANSNLRLPVAQEFGGFDPFERVADYLAAEVAKVHTKK